MEGEPVVRIHEVGWRRMPVAQRILMVILASSGVAIVPIGLGLLVRVPLGQEASSLFVVPGTRATWMVDRHFLCDTFVLESECPPEEFEVRDFWLDGQAFRPGERRLETLARKEPALVGRWVHRGPGPVLEAVVYGLPWRCLAVRVPQAHSGPFRGVEHLRRAPLRGCDFVVSPLPVVADVGSIACVIAAL